MTLSLERSDRAPNGDAMALRRSSGAPPAPTVVARVDANSFGSALDVPAVGEGFRR